MSTVVDASILVAALVDSGSNGSWAEKILAAGALYAPELVCVEATNILRRLERVGQIETSDANAAHDDLMQLDLELFPFEPFAQRIWELRHNLTSYDAWYVAVAESCALPLATLNTKLAKARGVSCEFLTPNKL